MKMTFRSLPLIATTVLAVSLAGCAKNDAPATTPTPSGPAKNAGNFTTTVFLGDSLTAGFQSGSLLDSAQKQGWASLVATQAAFNITLPLIAAPGAPAVLQLVTVNPLVINSASGITTGRTNPTSQPTDLAVPGAVLNDVVNTVPVLIPTTGQQIITQFVLGYPGLATGQANSQATSAVKANPTTIFLWIGNNDALVADTDGTPASMTPVAAFTTQYQALMNQLTTQTSAHLVIGNIPDVTLVPYLQPAATVLAQASASSGIPAATLSTTLGITTGDLVNPAGTAQVTAILTGKQKGPITDAGFLSAAEVVTVKAQIAAYNQVISTQATAAGATLVDINALFSQIATSGVSVSGVTGTSGFLGGIFSLDGIHPTNTGYAVIANKFIDTMNASISTKIPDVVLPTVAAADPLWPVNLAKHADLPAIQSQAIPANALNSIDYIIRK
jgi:lysophospholipase L1-like esterase